MKLFVPYIINFEGLVFVIANLRFCASNALDENVKLLFDFSRLFVSSGTFLKARPRVIDLLLNGKGWIIILPTKNYELLHL